MQIMKNFFQSILRLIILLLTLLVFRPKVYYSDKKKQRNRLKSPCIIVSNHIHHLDGPVIGSVFRKDKIHYLAAKDRFENKMLSWVMNQCRCIPIDRHDLDTQWIHQSLELLKIKKEPICIFPEGMHGKNGEILPFHSGVTTIAFLAKVPILMIYIDGPYQVIFGKRHRMMIGVPFELETPEKGLTADFIQSETEKLHTKMLGLQQEFYQKINNQ